MEVSLGYLIIAYMASYEATKKVNDRTAVSNSLSNLNGLSVCLSACLFQSPLKRSIVGHLVDLIYPTLYPVSLIQSVLTWEYVSHV